MKSHRFHHAQVGSQAQSAQQAPIPGTLSLLLQCPHTEGHFLEYYFPDSPTFRHWPPTGAGCPTYTLGHRKQIAVCQGPFGGGGGLEFGHWPCSLYKRLRICFQGPGAIPKKLQTLTYTAFALRKALWNSTSPPQVYKRMWTRTGLTAEGTKSKNQKCCFFLQTLVSGTQEGLWEGGPEAQVQKDSDSHGTWLWK